MSVWWRSLSTAFWLGWKVESNWTDPYLFILYSIIRPVAAALILVFMYVAVTRHTAGPMLGFLVVGTALWPFALTGVRGMVFGILEDREQFQTIRVYYTTPMSYRAYLVGRSSAQMLSVASFTAGVTLLIGRYALGVHYDVALRDVPTIAAAMALGTLTVLALGLLVASLALLISHEAWNMPDGVGAALYLLSGAIFPLTILPAWLEGTAKAFPTSWWMEAMRRALLPRPPTSFPGWSDGAVLGMLALLTFASAALSVMLFRRAETRARRLGVLDARTGY